MNKPKQRRFTVAPTLHYFTLVELLVVITVISILAGLLLPALSRARDQARQISCGSNEKQTGIAMIMYADDYRDWLPEIFDANTPWQNSWCYDHEFVTYLNLKRTYKVKTLRPASNALECPSDKSTSESSISYTANMRLNRPDQSWGVRLSKFQEPTRIITLTDGNNFGFYESFLDRIEYRHNQGINILYLDFHVAHHRGILDESDVKWK